MDTTLLLAYVGLLVLAWWRSRSLAWVVVSTACGVAVVGTLASGLIDLGVRFDRKSLQLTLAAILVVVVVASWFRGSCGTVSRRIQLRAVMVPVGLVLGVLAVVTWFWTDGPAFVNPVGFLIGQSTAEDNSRWLDFTSQWASGDAISQAAPMGGPLQLYLTFVGTAMAVYSEALFGGLNEVAVAANTVIFGQYLLVAAMPLAFATLAEAKFRAPKHARRGEARARGLVPVPLVWTGAAVLVAAALSVMTFGHLTLQFTFLAVTLWVATFISPVPIPRARLVTSLIVAASMTVWVPMAPVAVFVIGGWFLVFVLRGVRGGLRSVDWVGVALLIVVTIGVSQPLVSGFSYMAFHSAAISVLGVTGSIAASVVVSGMPASILFSSVGGTDQAGPVLLLLALVATVAASVVVTRQRVGGAYRALAPIGILVVVAVGIYFADFWGTTGGPHYGSLKFSFMVAIVLLAACLPVGLLLLDGRSVSGMTGSRWIAIAGVVFALTVDTLLPRALGQLRPDLWSPPIPFNNTSGSYWYPAEVNGLSEQPIESNPIACVYVPEGYPAPTAIVPSGLSDPQRVYSCTRQLIGLGGLDTQAQDVVAWLRREWFTNTPAWSDVHDGLSGLPAEVLDRRVIILDDGSNVKGIETLRSLLAIYPKDAAQTG